MFSNAEIAQVLEDAADLYESDKVEWCRNSWGGADPWPDGTIHLTACAATSLGLAVGLGVQVPGLIDNIYQINSLSDEELDQLIGRVMTDVDAQWLAAQAVLYGGSTMRYSIRGIRLYKAVRELLDRRVGMYGSGTVPNYNDNRGRTKEQVIDLFKETAKELRNAG